MRFLKPVALMSRVLTCPCVQRKGSRPEGGQKPPCDSEDEKSLCQGRRHGYSKGLSGDGRCLPQIDRTEWALRVYALPLSDQMWTESPEGHSPTKGHTASHKKSGTRARPLGSASGSSCHVQVALVTLSFRQGVTK